MALKSSLLTGGPMPARLAKAAACLLIAYWVVTALGIALTYFFAALYPAPAPPAPGASMYDIPAYAMTLPYHPLLNLLVWPWLAGWYLRDWPAPASSREALRLALFWTIATMAVDLIGWVLIRHPWSLTLHEFYVDYQPWITLVYAVIFAAPLVVARLMGAPRASRHRDARPA
jgi:hypothetical protein